jgi:hypothetical protein
MQNNLLQFLFTALIKVFILITSFNTKLPRNIIIAQKSNDVLTSIQLSSAKSEHAIIQD